MIDLTSFGKYEVTGADSAKFVDYIYGNEVPQVNVLFVLVVRGLARSTLYRTLLWPITFHNFPNVNKNTWPLSNT